MKNKIIFAIVIHYKAYAALEKTLQSLSKLKIPSGYTFTTIIVDQDFSLPDMELLKRKFPSCVYLPDSNNLGVGGAFNKGLMYGYNKGGSYFFLLPADMTISSNSFIKLIEKIKESNTIGMVCPKVLFNTNPRKILFIGGTLDKKAKSSIHIGHNEVDLHQYDDITETDLLSCPVLVRREVLQKVGLLNPKYFMYYEDTDWYLRTKRAGFTLRVVQEAVSYTDEPSNQQKTVRRKNYYITRNLLFFIKNNFSAKEQLIAYAYVFRETIFLLLDLLKPNHRERAYFKLLGVKDFLLRRSGKVNLFI